MIKITYINFWKDEYNDKYLSKFIENNLKCNVTHVNCNENPDILIASVNGNINIIDKIKAKCKIFYYGENLDMYPPYNNIELLKSKFNIITGFKYTDKKNKIFRFPLWLIYYPFYNFDDEKNNIISYIENKYYINIRKYKSLFATLVSRHDIGGKRKIIYDVMSKYYKVYCPGKFNNNTKKIGQSQREKIDYISNSLYNICPENSSSEGYITEKIFQAFEAGTIPLYWGHDLPEKNILNKNKYCFCNIKDSRVLKEQINDIMSNKEKYLKGTIFNENAKNIIEIYYNDLINEIKKYINVL
jgi:hypothetical protein